MTWNFNISSLDLFSAYFLDAKLLKKKRSMTGMVENGEWSVAHKKYDFQAIRVRISELVPTGAKPRMYRVGRNTLIKALKNRIIQASEGTGRQIQFKNLTIAGKMVL
jgi:hypothetical protein